MTIAIPIYQTELEKMFRYDIDTNILERIWRGLYWRVVKAKPRRDGYCDVKFNGRNIRIHRLIYTLVYGDIPENFQIDHIDNNKANNNINNLQLLSPKDNSAKSGCGINPSFDYYQNSYRVRESVWFGEERHHFFFKHFKDKAEAQDFCDAYNALFGWGKPYYSARTGTHKEWLEYMKAFKAQYFNEVDN